VAYLSLFVVYLFIYLFIIERFSENLSPSGPNISVTALGDMFSWLGDIYVTELFCQKMLWYASIQTGRRLRHLYRN